MSRNYTPDQDQVTSGQATTSAEDRNRQAAEDRVRNQDSNRQGEEGLESTRFLLQ